MGKGVGTRQALSPAGLASAQRHLGNKGVSWGVIKIGAEGKRKKVDYMADFGVGELIAAVAAAKGSDTEGMDVEYLLDPSLARMLDLQAVTDRPGFEPEALIKRLRQAVENQETVGIHGDYDCDGIMSSIMVFKALLHYLPREKLHVVLPGRQAGFGFNVGNVERLMDEGCTLIISTDCGTIEQETVDAIKKRGCDAVVIDHHKTPHGAFVTDAIVLNPQTLDREDPESPRQFLSFCASGLAWKVARELHMELLGEVPQGHEASLAYAAMGTIADMVPLTYENRILVYQGLRAMNDLESLAPLTMMRKWTGTAYAKGGIFRQPTALDLGMNLQPKLNIGKRVSDPLVDAKYVWDLLEGGYTRTEQLDHVANITRVFRQKSVDVSGYIRMAEKQVEGRDTLCNYVLLSGMPEGLCGEVAQKLMRSTRKPTIVLSNARVEDQGALLGSGRAPYPLDFLDVVVEASDHSISKLGGHAQAVGGIRVLPDDFDAFCQRVEEGVRTWWEANPAIKEQAPAIHAVVRLGDWSSQVAYQVEHHLAPYGIGNPEPVFSSYEVRVKSKRVEPYASGSGFKVNVGYTFEQNGVEIEAVSRQGSGIDEELGVTQVAARDVPEGAIVNIMYNIATTGSGDDLRPFIKLKAAQVLRAPRSNAPVAFSAAATSDPRLAVESLVEATPPAPADPLASAQTEV